MSVVVLQVAVFHVDRYDPVQVRTVEHTVMQVVAGVRVSVRARVKELLVRVECQVQGGEAVLHRIQDAWRELGVAEDSVC